MDENKSPEINKITITPIIGGLKLENVGGNMKIYRKTENEIQAFISKRYKSEAVAISRLPPSDEAYPDHFPEDGKMVEMGRTKPHVLTSSEVPKAERPETKVKASSYTNGIKLTFSNPIDTLDFTNEQIPSFIGLFIKHYFDVITAQAKLIEKLNEKPEFKVEKIDPNAQRSLDDCKKVIVDHLERFPGDVDSVSDFIDAYNRGKNEETENAA